MAGTSPIIESIYDTEIFLERRRRIKLKDVFIYDHLGLIPIVVYIAQAETPETDGTFRHGYAFYDVKAGKAVTSGTLLQHILFSKLPRISGLSDIDADPEYAKYPQEKERIIRLLGSLVKNYGLTAEETAEYEEYLDTMKAIRPASLGEVYDFFRAHIPAPRVERP